MTHKQWLKACQSRWSSVANKCAMRCYACRDTGVEPDREWDGVRHHKAKDFTECYFCDTPWPDDLPTPTQMADRRTTAAVVGTALGSLALAVLALGCASSGRMDVGPPVMPHLVEVRWSVDVQSPMLDIVVQERATNP